jgi:hypothetical protein
MNFNTVTWPSVGADKSALAGFSDIRIILLNRIIAPLSTFFAPLGHYFRRETSIYGEPQTSCKSQI